MAEPENPGECGCCNFETNDLKFYDKRDHPGPKKESLWLCELCAGTMASTMREDPLRYVPGLVSIVRSICYVGNAIIEEVRNRNKPKCPSCGFDDWECDHCADHI